MNRSRIDWTEYTWNPVTGCYHTCPYCYARKQSARFAGDVRLNLADLRCEMYQGVEGLYVLNEPYLTYNNRSINYPFGFAPTLHEYRLDWPGKVKNSANIFVGSMADLFGEWVPDEWIQKVFEACDRYPQHNYMFLTKNPPRYLRLTLDGILPDLDNMWYGASVTSQEDMERVSTLAALESGHRFLSIEPLFGGLELLDLLSSGKGGIDWVILGAETGNRKGKIIPEKEWIQEVARQCRVAGVPLFMKESLRELISEFIQEYPVGLLRKELSPKLKKKLWGNCNFCGTEKPKKEMIALLYRKSRGKSAKQLGYACPECFESLTEKLMF